MSTAIVASRINTDPTCRRSGIKAIDFDIWHFEHSDQTPPRHVVNLYYVWTGSCISAEGPTFTAALDAAMDKLRALIPPKDDRHTEQPFGF